MGNSERLLHVQRPIRNALRRRGIEITRYGQSVTARRQKLLEHHGIEMVLDVGANVGQYGQMLRRAGYRGQILSFEPLGSAFEQLEAAAADDPAWQAVRAAIGDEDGTIELQVTENSIFSSVLSMNDEAQRAAGGGTAVAVETVDMKCLDDIVPDALGTLALKIDVQGFERAVLDGGQDTLRRARLVEMELSPREVYEGQMLMDEALQRMSNAGFVLALTENLLMDPVSGRSLQFDGIFVRA